MAKEYKKGGGGEEKNAKKSGAKSFGFTVKVSEILRDTEKESKRAQNLMPKNKNNNNNNKKNEAKLERLLKQRDFTPVLHFFLYLDFYSNVI